MIITIDRKNNHLEKQMFWTLLPAQIMTSLTASLGQIINSFLVGNSLPQEALAAISFTSPVTALLTGLSMVISTGAYVICGDYIGRARYEEIHKTFTSAVKGLALVGLIFTALIEIFATPFATLLGAEGPALTATASYLRGYFIGLIPLLVNPCLIAFLNMGGQSKYVVLSTVLYAVVNLALGLLNVKVIFGGIFGMGLVASIAAYATLFFFMVKFIKNKNLGHLEKGSFRWSEFGRMLRLGLGSASEHVCCAFRAMILNFVCMKYIGTEAVSATGILLNATALAECVGYGIGNVATMTSSVAAGSRNARQLESLYSYVQTRGCLLEVAVGAIQFVFARQLAMLFGAQGLVLELSVIAIRCYAVSQPLQQFLSYNTLSFFNSLRRIKLNTFLVVICILVVPAISMLTLGAAFGAVGIWAMYPVAQAVGILILFIIAWKQLGHAPKNLGEWIWVDKAFDVPLDNGISLATDKKEDISSISEKIQNHCKSHQVDRHTAYMAGLCMEEIAGNVIEHGFNKGKPGRKYVVDVFALVDNGRVTLSVRDNAPAFDPNARLKMYKEDPEHPEKSIGIRMVAKIADRMVYQSTFNCNVLNIELSPKDQTA